VAPAVGTPPPGTVPAAPAGPPTAGTGWRGGVTTRSRDAQEALDLGRTELAAGRTRSALAHLRRALQVAPGDAEIAAEVGRAMKGG
jgi:cytochrome c-type biogenesis protein CcmH/NrfG